MKPATMPDRKEKPRSCSARSSCTPTQPCLRQGKSCRACRWRACFLGPCAGYPICTSRLWSYHAWPSQAMTCMHALCRDHCASTMCSSLFCHKAPLPHAGSQSTSPLPGTPLASAILVAARSFSDMQHVRKASSPIATSLVYASPHHVIALPLNKACPDGIGIVQGCLLQILLSPRCLHTPVHIHNAVSLAAERAFAWCLAEAL